MSTCKNCGTDIEQSPIGRSREYCDRACGEAFRKRFRQALESGQLGQIEAQLVQIEERLEVVAPRRHYSLPVHLMFQNGPTLVMPAPASR